MSMPTACGQTSVPSDGKPKELIHKGETDRRLIILVESGDYAVEIAFTKESGIGAWADVSDIHDVPPFMIRAGQQVFVRARDVSGVGPGVTKVSWIVCGDAG